MPLAPILSVDVEDWFHVCGRPEYGEPGTWAGREKRVHVGTDAILALLDGTRSRATFFVLGWVARQCPSLVRRIADAGHEIGSHGDLHRRVFELTQSEFRSDVRRARGTLEDVIGARVTAFRAPEWSMRTTSSPALAILAEEGFLVDSSLVAARRIGVATNPSGPAWVTTGGGDILEVPPLTGTFFFFRAIVGGGVCSRLSRVSRVEKAIDAALARGVPPVLYCHPWELDPEHPSMPGLGAIGWLVHFGGRRRAGPRLSRLLRRYVFRPVSSALEVCPRGARSLEGAAA
jgi:polysaccharide deacetylase family protein (PEP-CTERM system associated)